MKKLVDLNGTPTMVVGVPLAASSAEYFEIASLSELQRTLSVLGWSLTATAAFTTVVGATLGRYASRRVLRPLREFSAASAAVGRGRLDTRLSVAGDPDLRDFGATFNDMAEALERRTERDARFASDVSHELRNPLTALTAAVDVLDTRTEERSRPAVDVLRAQVAHFQRLVLDLLELSRLDSGHAELALVDVDPRQFFAAMVHEIAGDVPVDVTDRVSERLSIDKRRVERVLTNLLDNASRHGGGATGVTVDEERGMLLIAVDDDGPGVPDDERALVFDRFRRGSRFTESTRGSGLGLAIVAEQCRAHGGDARVEKRAGGGARFVARLRDGGHE